MALLEVVDLALLEVVDLDLDLALLEVVDLAHGCAYPFACGPATAGRGVLLDWALALEDAHVLQARRCAPGTALKTTDVRAARPAHQYRHLHAYSRSSPYRWPPCHRAPALCRAPDHRDHLPKPQNPKP